MERRSCVEDSRNIGKYVNIKMEKNKFVGGKPGYMDGDTRNTWTTRNGLLEKNVKTWNGKSDG